MNIEKNARLIDESDAIISQYLNDAETEVLYAILSKFKPEERIKIVEAMY